MSCGCFCRNNPPGVVDPVVLTIGCAFGFKISQTKNLIDGFPREEIFHSGESPGLILRGLWGIEVLVFRYVREKFFHSGELLICLRHRGLFKSRLTHTLLDSQRVIRSLERGMFPNISLFHSLVLFLVFRESKGLFPIALGDLFSRGGRG